MTKRLRVLHCCTIFPQSPEDPRGVFIGRHVAAMQEYIDNTVLAPMSPITKKEESFAGAKVRRFTYWFRKKGLRIGYGVDTRRNIEASWLARLQVPPYLLCFLTYTFSMGRKADLVHAHGTFSAVFPIALNFLRRSKMPVVVTALGSDLRFLPAWLNRQIVKRASAITFPAPLFASRGYAKEGHENLEEMLKRTESCEKFQELYYPLDERKFDAGRDKATSKREIGLGNAFVIGFLSRLEESKGALLFLQALPAVLAREPAIHFIVTSYGPLRDELSREVERQGLTTNVHFYNAPADIERYLSACDLLCQMCTVENLWSTILAEAAVMEVPCILSQVGQTAKLFTHRKDAYLVPLSREALAEGMLELFRDPALRKTIATGAKAMLGVRGRRDHLAKARYLKLYRRMATMKG